MVDGGIKLNDLTSEANCAESAAMYRGTQVVSLDSFEKLSDSWVPNYSDIRTLFDRFRTRQLKWRTASDVNLNQRNVSNVVARENLGLVALRKIAVENDVDPRSPLNDVVGSYNFSLFTIRIVNKS